MAESQRTKVSESERQSKREKQNQRRERIREAREIVREIETKSVIPYAALF